MNFTLTHVFRQIGRSFPLSIEVVNPDGVMKGVKEINLDDVQVERIPVQEAGTCHKVKIVMG